MYSANVLQEQESGFLILILMDTVLTFWSESFYSASRIGLWNHCSGNAPAAVAGEPPEEAQRVPQSVSGHEGIGSPVVCFNGAILRAPSRIVFGLEGSLVHVPSPWSGSCQSHSPGGIAGLISIY